MQGEDNAGDDDEIDDDDVDDGAIVANMIAKPRKNPLRIKNILLQLKDVYAIRIRPPSGDKKSFVLANAPGDCMPQAGLRSG